MRADARPSLPPQRLLVTPGSPVVQPDSVHQVRAEKISDALGAQTLVQDVARVAVLAGRSGRVATVASAAAGDTVAISRMVTNATRVTREVAEKGHPALARHVQRVAPGAWRGVGKVLHLGSKWAPVFGLPFVGYDVFKAIKTQDPTAKRAAWADAGLTIGGTALSTAGGVFSRTRAGMPMLVGSAAIAALQLADTYVLKGRLAQRLGDATAAGWNGLKPE